jgi:hypothetical protein
MITLYLGSGAGDFEILPGGLPAAETQALLSKVIRVLRVRGEERAVEILTASTFEIDEATNHFNDDFHVLRTVVPLARYEELRSTQSDPEMRAAFRVIAEVIGELQGPYIRFIVAVADLRGTPVVESPNLRTTSALVERALRDIEDLLRASGGAPSSVDRAHTALHGHLRLACRECGLTVSETDTLTTLLKRLRESHPNLRDLGPRPDDMMRVLRALSKIVDALNPLRNHASVAHPNETLLPQPEAMLVVNAVRTILHYLDSKLRPTSETTP